MSMVEFARPVGILTDVVVESSRSTGVAVTTKLGADERQAATCHRGGVGPPRRSESIDVVAARERR